MISLQMKRNANETFTKQGIFHVRRMFRRITKTAKISNRNCRRSSKSRIIIGWTSKWISVSSAVPAQIWRVWSEDLSDAAHRRPSHSLKSSWPRKCWMESTSIGKSISSAMMSSWERITHWNSYMWHVGGSRIRRSDFSFGRGSLTSRINC